MTRHKRPESVLVLVYAKSGEVLLLRRKKPAYFWQSVAGSLEWGEQPRPCALRELREETGLPGTGLTDCNTVNRYLLYPLWRHRYAPGVIENTEHVFRLELERPCAVRLDEREHGEYRWLGGARAAAMVSSHTNRAAIERWVNQRRGGAGDGRA